MIGLKSKKGVTLISLVITTIIIIIISSISLGYILGNKGLLKQIETTKEENEYAIVQEVISLKVSEYMFKENKEKYDSAIMLLLDQEYVDYDYKINMDKVKAVNLKKGYGTIEEGDYYSLKNEKLVYVDKEKNEKIIQEYSGIGIIPVNIYMEAKTELKKVNLEIDGKFETNLSISNFKDDLITWNDIEYEIGLVDNDTAFNVFVNNVKINENKYEDIIKGKNKEDRNYKLNVELKPKSYISNEKIKIRIKVIKPISFNKTIEIDASNILLKDHSSNKYHAELMNGTKIIRDENGKYALSFDGVDDYVKIPALKSGFDWKSGVDVEVELSFDDLAETQTILHLSNGNSTKDNVIIQKEDENNKIVTKVQGNNDIEKLTHENSSSSNIINVKEKVKVKYDMYSNFVSIYKSNIYINDKKDSGDGNYMSQLVTPIQNNERNLNAIGRNAIENNQYFKGKIYSIRAYVNSGECIFDYNLNK